MYMYGYFKAVTVYSGDMHVVNDIDVNYWVVAFDIASYNLEWDKLINLVTRKWFTNFYLPVFFLWLVVAIHVAHSPIFYSCNNLSVHGNTLLLSAVVI